MLKNKVFDFIDVLLLKVSPRKKLGTRSCKLITLAKYTAQIYTINKITIGKIHVIFLSMDSRTGLVVDVKFHQVLWKEIKLELLYIRYYL